jgi:hypothetical protein
MLSWENENALKILDAITSSFHSLEKNLNHERIKAVRKPNEFP